MGLLPPEKIGQPGERRIAAARKARDTTRLGTKPSPAVHHRRASNECRRLILLHVLPFCIEPQDRAAQHLGHDRADSVAYPGDPGLVVSSHQSAGNPIN